MTAKMVRFDDEYQDEFNNFVSLSDGKVKIIKDPNLELDPYFYERKASLDKTIQAIDSGKMKMITEEEWEIELQKIDKEIEKKYGY